MTFVKICGITNLEDALAAVEAGADALGFNFYEQSPRYVTPETAREIIDQLPDNVYRVGVFVDEKIDRLIQIIELAGIGAVQIHGGEDREYIEELRQRKNLEIIKAFRVSEDYQPEDLMDQTADAVLLDAYSPREFGGTGQLLDWKLAATLGKNLPKFFLAGGLSEINVAEAIDAVSPFAVDACSRLESSPGKKDVAKVKAFIEAAKGIK